MQSFKASLAFFCLFAVLGINKAESLQNCALGDCQQIPYSAMPLNSGDSIIMPPNTFDPVSEATPPATVDMQSNPNKPESSTSVDTSTHPSRPGTVTQSRRAPIRQNNNPTSGSDDSSSAFGKAGGNAEFDASYLPSSPTQPQPAKSPATTAATPAAPSELVNQAQTALSNCRKQAATARTCCTNPIACMTGSSDAQGAYQMVSQLAAAGGTLMLGASGGDPAQLQQICNVMQDLSYGSAGANATFAGVCYSEKSSCQDKCDLSQYKNQIDGLTPDDKAKLTTAMSDASTTAGTCQQLNEQVAQMSKQAMQGAVGGSLSSLCANISKASTGYSNLDKQSVFNVDCSLPSNQANPACLNCGQAQNANNPICKTQTVSNGQSLGDGSLSSLSSKANFGAGLGAANVNANAGLDGNGTAKNIQGGAATPTTNPGVAANSGQFLGGASAGSNFGLPDRGGQGRGQGYNTDVLNGTSGGGGYTVSSVPVNGSPGGGGNYMSTDKDGKPVDLRDYLPGHRLDPKRAVASVSNLKHPELGSKEENIFERIHKVYMRKWYNGEFVMVNEKPGDGPSPELLEVMMKRPLLPIEIKTGKVFKGKLPPELEKYMHNDPKPSAQMVPSSTPPVQYAQTQMQMRQPAQAAMCLQNQRVCNASSKCCGHCQINKGRSDGICLNN